MGDESLGVLKYVIGPFVGASLAFFLARIYDGHKRFKEKVVAANLALLTLKNQYGDFVLFRRAFIEDVARIGDVDDLPVWLHVRPSFMSYGNYAMEYESLGFLFETIGGGTVLDDVEHVQILYRALVELDKYRTEIAKDAQLKVAEYHRVNPKFTDDDIANHLGKAVVAGLNMVTTGLAIRALEDGKTYVLAFDRLRNAVLNEFESMWQYRWQFLWRMRHERSRSILIRMTTPKRFRLETLPQLPEVIRAAIQPTIDLHHAELASDQQL